MSAIDDIAAERARQIAVEGWSTEHDDEHRYGELAKAAASYAYGSTIGNFSRRWWFPSDMWPWDKSWWKLTSPRRDLVKAGALIVAEIERLDRAAQNAKRGRPVTGALRTKAEVGRDDMKVTPLAQGKQRQWVKCNKCARPAYYDFTPYSLSNPIMTMPCGHGLGIDHTTRITADEALVLLSEPMSAIQ